MTEMHQCLVEQRQKPPLETQDRGLIGAWTVAHRNHHLIKTPVSSATSRVTGPVHGTSV